MKTISELKKSAPETEKPLRNVCMVADLMQIRKRNGITLQQIADQLGCTRQAVNLIESGGGVHIATALKLARFYELPVESIWALRSEEVA